MPIIYEEKRDSAGNTYSTGNIETVYRNYYGETPYTNFKQFSMIASKQDLEYVLEKLDIQEVENLLEPLSDCFTLNVDLIKKTITLTEAGKFLFIEICFVTDFKNIIK